MISTVGVRWIIGKQYSYATTNTNEAVSEGDDKIDSRRDNILGITVPMGSGCKSRQQRHSADCETVQLEGLLAVIDDWFSANEREFIESLDSREFSTFLEWITFLWMNVRAFCNNIKFLCCKKILNSFSKSIYFL